jgi:hypothetical protein
LHVSLIAVVLSRLPLFTLSGAIVLGIGLALWHLRGGDGRRAPSPWIGWVHGTLGITGLVGLGLMLSGPARGVAMGVGSFGSAAAVMLAVAVVLGLAIPSLARRNPLGAAVTIVVHAGLAITAYVLFLAWISVG